MKFPKRAIESLEARLSCGVNPVSSRMVTSCRRAHYPDYMSRQRAVIADVDGTLAMRGTRSPYDWSTVNLDSPNKSVVDVVRLLAVDSQIIYVSGRDERSREGTRTWIDEYVGVPGQLYLRRAGDRRKDSIVKPLVTFRVPNQTEVGIRVRATISATS